MPARRSHGALGLEPPRPDELPLPPAGAAVPISTARDAKGRVTTSEAARAMASMPRRSAFVPRKVAADPRFEVHNRRRLEWLKRRRVEIFEATGGLSAGAGAMLAAAAWCYAASEFLSERGATTADAESFRAAASLSTTARQHDLAAWELATREAHARPRAPFDPIARFMGSGSVEPDGANDKPEDDR